ncbi:hypothetical protein [Hydrogenovibrio marinus]|uniref:Lipoprotein n=1 Tax=Hydrogenovibrio marinus TaxID=28885 RepID=A0A066ZY75_HYDMR|nr:hypothetical protein [Hydrogenovibrio marinus]KDN95301.1 hypothetical protein EI16_03085 [Hydrogenovibrio marinus]BBN59783.1 hypothetical protein HVMH_1377 [Hydrogenovibrio marinus]
MKSHISWGIALLMLMTLSGCASHNARNINLGDMMPGEMISLKDGTKLACAVEFISSHYEGGKITAFNSTTNEAFSGRYHVMLVGGGSSTGVVTNAWGFTTGSIKTTSDATAATAKGVLTGSKGTVIDISLNLTPTKNPNNDYAVFFSGQGTGVDNRGARYQIYFGPNYYKK